MLAARAAGSVTGMLHHVTLVGDGSKVFVTDFDTGVVGGGCSGLAEVRGGRPVILPGPRTEERALTRLDVREPGGALWVVSEWQHRAPNGPVRGKFPQRITEKGATMEVTGLGVPMLADSAGNLWFGRGAVRWDHVDRFAILRGDRVVRQLTPAGADVQSGQISHTLWEQRPGVVWAWSHQGLQRFNAPDRERPWDYVVGTTRVVLGLDHSVQGAKFSALGYAILEADAGVYLVKLPGEQN